MNHLTPNTVLLLVLSVWALFSSPALADAPTYAWLYDQTEQRSLDELQTLKADTWRPFEAGRTLNLGFRSGVIWVRVSVPPEPHNRVLELGYPLLDQVDVFWVRDGEIVQRHQTGDARPFHSRPLHHRNFVFLVPSNSDLVTAYVRVQTEGSLQIPVRVVPSAEFLADEQLSYGWQTMFLGIITAMALYNLFLFLIVRQLNYLFYVLSVVSLGLIQLHLHGVLFQWLWPDAPGFNHTFMVLVSALALVSSLLFTLHFLSVRQHSLWGYRLLLMLLACSVVSLCYGLLAPYQSGIVVVSVLAALVAPASWLIGLLLWSRGQALAGFYVLAWTPLLLGYLVLVLSKLGYLPDTFITRFSSQIGVAIEVILLSFALAYRINQERRRRLQAQAHTLQVQRQANLTLEARVQERTEELQRANQRLQAISLTDGLTQVANRRQFDDKLDLEWHRGVRQQQPLSLLLLDIDHFKKVNDRFGHLVGDDCLVAVASLCAAEIQRSGDLLARYGGEEFAVILPATTEAGAEQVAERLRRVVCQAPVFPGAQETAIPLSVSVGVATLLPQQQGRPVELIRRADTALYRAKQEGRNRVCHYHDGGSLASDQT